MKNLKMASESDLVPSTRRNTDSTQSSNSESSTSIRKRIRKLFEHLNMISSSNPNRSRTLDKLLPSCSSSFNPGIHKRDHGLSVGINPTEVFPPELFLIILDPLPHSSLLSFALSSKSCYILAIPTLQSYANIRYADQATWLSRISSPEQDPLIPIYRRIHLDRFPIPVPYSKSGDPVLCQILKPMKKIREVVFGSNVEFNQWGEFDLFVTVVGPERLESMRNVSLVMRRIAFPVYPHLGGLYPESRTQAIVNNKSLKTLNMHIKARSFNHISRNTLHSIYLRAPNLQTLQIKLSLRMDNYPNIWTILHNSHHHYTPHPGPQPHPHNALNHPNHQHNTNGTTNNNHTSATTTGLHFPYLSTFHLSCSTPIMTSIDQAGLIDIFSFLKRHSSTLRDLALPPWNGDSGDPDLFETISKSVMDDSGSESNHGVSMRSPSQTLNLNAGISELKITSLRCSLFMLSLICLFSKGLEGRLVELELNDIVECVRPFCNPFSTFDDELLQADRELFIRNHIINSSITNDLKDPEEKPDLERLELKDSKGQTEDGHGGGGRVDLESSSSQVPPTVQGNWRFSKVRKLSIRPPRRSIKYSRIPKYFESLEELCIDFGLSEDTMLLWMKERMQVVKQIPSLKTVKMISKEGIVQQFYVERRGRFGPKLVLRSTS
ncbi:hypothetical protein C8Q75DRAFT_763804 [Abortiporus biennis]|nr:hypothetical protein C8Q75DRAFT_763804 [Abortiporus biennis]